MLAAASLRVVVGRLEHCADVVDRRIELAVVLSADRRRPCRRVDEAEEYAKRGRLAGAVRAEEARDTAVRNPEREAVDRGRLAEPLAEVDDLDHRAILDRRPGRGSIVSTDRLRCTPGKARTS